MLVFFHPKDHEEFIKFKFSTFFSPLDRIMKKTEESELHLESEIKRKVPQKRHSSTYQSAPSPLSPASKKCLTDLEVSREIILYYSSIGIFIHIIFSIY